MARPEMYSADEKAQFLNDLRGRYNGQNELQKKEIVSYAEETSRPVPNFIFTDDRRKMTHGRYYIGDIVETNNQTVVSRTTQSLEVSQISDVEAEYFIPDKDSTYVPFGFFQDLKKIVASGMFYPTYITGLSGNGKTLMVLQACAHLGREVIRVNITKDTDEFDLFGNYELINGTTYRRKGPVLTAMERGAILLLDEIDYGTERILCLQGVLEGRPWFDKKRGVLVRPQPGFNVICTANTKGKGDFTGRFIGANVLNEAFLERFPLTVEQEYPSKEIETKIIKQNLEALNVPLTPMLTEMTQDLVNWASLIRKTYEDGAIDEIISTRRIVTIIKTFVIFQNSDKAIDLSINRFDSETKAALKDAYNKVKGSRDLGTVQAKTNSITVSAAEYNNGNFPRLTHNEYVTLAATLNKVYKTAIVITKEMGKLVVVSHGHVTAVEETSMSSYSTNPHAFQQELIKLIDMNMSSFNRKP